MQVQRQWQAKIECQQEREERDARLLARQEEALRLAVELRSKRVEREDLRMQGGMLALWGEGRRYDLRVS